MHPIDQEFLHNPNEGTYGDCQRAVIASYFELPIYAVPHFLHDNCDGIEFNRRLNHFLDGLGYILKLWFKDDLEKIIQTYGKDYIYCVCDRSPRGVFHVCLAMDGAIMHDPHPSKAGLHETSERWYETFHKKGS